MAAPPPPPAAPPAAATAAPLEVDTGDVIRLIQQFLREHGLSRSLAALQEESDVALNCVDDVGAFTSDVLAGRWDAVLPRVAAMALPAAVLSALYEQVALELVEAREGDVARALLRGALPLQALAQDEPARFARLEHLVAGLATGRVWDAGAELYSDGRGRDARRADVARALGEHIVAVPPSRLTTMLAHALQWQRAHGALPAGGGGGAWDVFRDLAPAPAHARRDAEERPPSKPAGVIRGGAMPQCAAFTPDGASLVVGSDDGIIEVYDASTGSLRGDLAYQAADEFMMLDDAVTCVAVSADSELLASGSKDGKIKVWRLATGECLRRFPTAHPDGGVSCLAFCGDTTLQSVRQQQPPPPAGSAAPPLPPVDQAGSQLLSGGMDGVARIHGLRSGKLLKEFRGHSSFVNSVAFTTGGVGGVTAAASVVTGSSDGSVRTWDVRTTECVSVFKPPQAAATSDVPVLAVVPFPASRLGGLASGGGARQHHVYLVLSRGTAAHVCTATGSVLRTLNSGGGAGAALLDGSGAPLVGAAAACTFVAGVVTPQAGRWAYLLGDDGSLRCFSLAAGGAGAAGGASAPAAVLPLAGGAKAPLGVVAHPLRNLVAAYGADGAVRLWKAAAA